MGRGRSNGDFRFEITVDPSPVKLAKIIDGLGDEFRNWRPAWARIAPILSRGILRNIASKGASIGEGWAQPNAQYMRRKAKRWGQIDLVRTGAMMAQLSSPTDGVISVGPRHLSFGTNKPQARAVNFGRNAGKGKRTKVASRWFMGWSDSMQRDAAKEMDDYARSLIQKASARLSTAGA